ncbi:ABC transporter permease [Symbiobacterium thermophilum]|uniref:ABC transporter permease n=1 Tax=Symbiobacterium thermophilum TaxID=2734 RepID=UPI0002FCFEE5|nr:ABC transporter permease [Symbiobacterium thermophilum]
MAAAREPDTRREDARTGRRVLRQALRQLWRRKVALLGVLMVLGAVICALFAPVLAPHDPNAQQVQLRLLPPFWMEGAHPAYPLGTDHLGRDILSRLIYGSRVSLTVGLSAVLIAGGIGTAAGLAAGYLGGAVDDLVGRLGDVQLAFPFTLLALVVMAVLGTGMGKTIAVLGITGWVFYARVLRSEVLALRERDFILASRALGNPGWRTVLRHLFPNVAGTLIVLATLEVPRVIITESALTFLGLGIQPPTVTWGGMLADARNYITTHWWVATFPGLALQLTVLGLNLTGDFLREILDPRLNS